MRLEDCLFGFRLVGFRGTSVDSTLGDVIDVAGVSALGRFLFPNVFGCVGSELEGAEESSLSESCF